MIVLDINGNKKYKEQAQSNNRERHVWGVAKKTKSQKSRTCVLWVSLYPQMGIMAT